MTKTITPEDYGYNPDMTMVELKALFDTLNQEQAAELSRLLKAAAKAHFAHADALEADHYRRYRPETAANS